MPQTRSTGCSWVILAICIYIYPVFSSHCTISSDKKDVNCAGLGLTEIPNYFPTNARIIDLSNNLIKTIPNQAFNNTKHLQKLFLDDNQIHHLENQAFYGLNRLNVLSMRRNKLQIDKVTFKDGIFKPLKRVKILSLSQNLEKCKSDTNIERSHYPDEEFGRLKTLQKLSLDLYPFPVFGPGFQRMKSLKTIDFNYCCLSNLENDTFKYLPSSLIELHMTNCKKININVGIAALQNFVQLDLLDLKFTTVSLRSALALLYPLQNRTMDTLNLCYVNGNQKLNGTERYAATVTEQMVKYLKSICVKRMNLGFNNIAVISKNSLFKLDRLECLEEVVLSGNSFHIVAYNYVDYIYFFTHAINLQVFEYSYVALEYPAYYRSYSGYEFSCGYFGGHLFQNITYILLPPKLHTIRISHLILYACLLNFTYVNSNLHTIDISYVTIQDMYFYSAGLESVQYVDASGLDLTKSTPMTWKSFPNVKTLVLKNANLDRVFMYTHAQNIFNFTTEVENLDLSDNHLISIPEKFLSTMSNLKMINLSFNSMDIFPESLLDKNTLQVIDLSYNNFLGMSKTVLNWLDLNKDRSNGTKLYLYGNAFQCTCEHMDFIKWLFETNVELDHDRNYACTLSNGTLSTTIRVNQQYNEIFINCKSTFWLTFSIVGITVLLVLLLSSVIWFRLRWRILYFFYRHFHYGYTPIVADAENYIFDAFVAYSSADHTWVWSTLRPYLEESDTIKLCIHERDFAYAEYIQQNIINCISNSRKVIINASPNYITSKWFEFEVEMAKIEMSNRSYCNGIIVIIHKGTNPNDIPSLLKSIWNKITCVILEETEDEKSSLNRLASAIKE